MTTLYVDNIAPNLQSKISAPNLQLPSGSVVQTVTSKDTTIYAVSVSGGSSSASSQAPTVTLGTITPSATSSTILCHWTCPQIDHGSTASGLYLNIWRSIGGGAYSKLDLGGVATGSRHSAYYSNIDHSGDANRVVGGGFSGVFTDSPNTTSSVQYKLYVGFGDNQSITIYVNRTSADNNADYTGRAATHSVLQEIAG